MNSRPRRKCVSVSFVADEDVIQHIVDAHEKSSRKGKKSKSNTPSKDKLNYKEDLREDTPEVSEDEDETQIKAPSTLEEGNVLVGTDLFQFRTPKKSGQMAAKASESRTPKSILKKVKDLNENVTPGKDKKTPVKRKGKVKRPEATTPYRLRQRQLEVSDSEESFSSGDSEDDLDSDENSTPSGRNKSLTSRTPSGGSKPSTPKTPSGGSKTPSSIKRNHRQHEDTVDVPSMVQDYFDLHSEGPCATSDRTLAKLGTSKMDQETLSQLLHKIPSSHSKECTQMYTEHRSLFNQWMYQMCNNFNILLHGLGSKRTLLEDFRKTMLSELSHVVVNGYFPSLTVKHILNSITDEILEKEVSFKGPLDQVDYIKSEFESKDYRDFYLVMNNIDGMMLRGEKTQNILSLLSQIRGFHVIASIDHINASLIWDQGKCSRFNWLWFDVTTYLPYTDETSYENSLLVQQSGSLALSSMTHVMKSLTPNAKNIFILLTKHQLENKDNSTYIGMSIQDLYQRCREGFLVNSDLTLRAQLVEFKDHKLIKSKKSYDGIEHLMIPIDNATLTEFLEQHETS
ncbi:origin recognition complex subunit 2-like [Mytilus trossulus]|uniref:origin recognition complex subunit 2-like n=1 Tax=Mytilus trossulus TaxID=6551 RepID=UPI00300489F3